MLLGFCIGYAANGVMPLRIGEIVRTVLIHRRDGTCLSHVAATVFVERMLDRLAPSATLATLVAEDGVWP